MYVCTWLSSATLRWRAVVQRPHHEELDLPDIYLYVIRTEGGKDVQGGRNGEGCNWTVLNTQLHLPGTNFGNKQTIT